MKAVVMQCISVLFFSTLVISGWFMFVAPESEQTHTPNSTSEEPEPIRTIQPDKPRDDLSNQGSETGEQEIELVNIPGNYEYFDEEGISAEAAEEFRRLSVLPYNPLVTTCEHKWTTHKGQTEAIYEEVCTSKRKYPEHPYFSYEIESLLDFTQNKDLLAAAVLAERTKVTHPAESVALMLYSSFASGKPAQLLDYANSVFPIRNVNPAIRQNNLTDHYILTDMARRLGHPDADLSFAGAIPTEQLVKIRAIATTLHDNSQSGAEANLPFIVNNNPFSRSTNDKQHSKEDLNG